MIIYYVAYSAMATVMMRAAAHLLLNFDLKQGPSIHSCMDKDDQVSTCTRPLCHCHFHVAALSISDQQ